MTTPDTTAAFEAEADHADREERVKKLRAELAEMEAAPVEGELVDTDNEAEVETPEQITDTYGNTWHYFPPTQSQLTLFAMASTTSRSVSQQMQLKRINGFLANLFTEDSLDEMMERVEARDDDYQFQDIMDVVVDIIGKTTARQPANRAERRALDKNK